jgi:NAD(P)-dependent dehydrogenase (short-subunit alcohol dehydrogenase family)
MATTKIGLITGGSRGLGKDMAISMADEGNDVIITYKSNREEARKLADQLKKQGRKAAAIPLDMSRLDAPRVFAEEVKTVLKEVWNTEKFDFLVNNAGMGATVPFTEVTETLFDEFLNVHFKGVYFLTQQLLPLLNDGGRIINISSGTTRFANPGYSVYASMKGAIEVFTKYLAKELGSRQIRVNVIAPGPIETDFNSAGIRNNPQMKERLASLTPLGRVGRAEDIGGVVAFLCSEAGGWINGQRIEVSGGINV